MLKLLVLSKWSRLSCNITPEFYVVSLVIESGLTTVQNILVFMKGMICKIFNGSSSKDLTLRNHLITFKSLCACLAWVWLSPCGKFPMKIPQMSEKRTHLTHCQSISGINAKSDSYESLLCFWKRLSPFEFWKRDVSWGTLLFANGINSSIKRTPQQRSRNVSHVWLWE